MVGSMKRTVFKKGDIVIFSSVILLALTVFCLSFINAPGKEDKSLIITENGKKSIVSLDKDSCFELFGNGYRLNIVIEKGSAYVKSASCPDKTCVHSGKIDKNGEVIACVPAGIMLHVSAEEGGYDFIAG